jgi:hypothetical protein
VRLPETLASALARWKADHVALRERLQEGMGADRAIIDQVGPSMLGDGFDIFVYHIPELAEDELRDELTWYAEQWARARIVGS